MIQGGSKRVAVLALVLNCHIPPAARNDLHDGALHYVAQNDMNYVYPIHENEFVWSIAHTDIQLISQFPNLPLISMFSVSPDLAV